MTPEQAVKVRIMDLIIQFWNNEEAQTAKIAWLEARVAELEPKPAPTSAEGDPPQA